MFRNTIWDQYFEIFVLSAAWVMFAELWFKSIEKNKMIITNKKHRDQLTEN